MIKKFLNLSLIFIVFIAIFCAIHYAIIIHFNLSKNPSTTIIAYIVNGFITLFLFHIGCFVKSKYPENVGFVFMLGTVVKIAFFLILFLITPKFKPEIIGFIISYFLILFLETFLFINLININLKNINKN